MSAKGQKSALVTSKRDKAFSKKKSTTLLLPEGTTYNLANNRRNSLEDGTESSSDGESHRQRKNNNQAMSARADSQKTSYRLKSEPAAAPAPKKKSPSSYIDYRVYINDRYKQMEEDQERRDSISKLKLKDEYERSKYRSAPPAFNYFNSNPQQPSSNRSSTDDNNTASDEPAAYRTRRSMSAAPPISLFANHHHHHHFNEHRNSATSYSNRSDRRRTLQDDLEDLSASFNDSIFIQSVNHFKRPINV